MLVQAVTISSRPMGPVILRAVGDDEYIGKRIGRAGAGADRRVRDECPCPSGTRNGCRRTRVAFWPVSNRFASCAAKVVIYRR